MIKKNFGKKLPPFKVPDLMGGITTLNYTAKEWNGTLRNVIHDDIPVVGAHKMLVLHSGAGSYPANTIFQKQNFLTKRPRILVIRQASNSSYYILSSPLLADLKKAGVEVHSLNKGLSLGGWNTTTFGILGTCIPTQSIEDVDFSISSGAHFDPNPPFGGGTGWNPSTYDETHHKLHTDITQWDGGELLCINGHSPGVLEDDTFDLASKSCYTFFQQKMTGTFGGSLTHGPGPIQIVPIYHSAIATADRDLVATAFPRFAKVEWHIFVGNFTARLDDPFGGGVDNDVDGYITGTDPSGGDMISAARSNISTAVSGVSGVTLHDSGDGVTYVINPTTADTIIRNFFSL